MKTDEPAFRKSSSSGLSQSASTSHGYAAVAVDANGKLLPASSSILLDPSTGAVSIVALKGCTLTGKVNANGQELSNAQIVGGSINGVSSFSSSSVSIDDLRMVRTLRDRLNGASAGNAKRWAEASRVVFVDPGGKLISTPSHETEVHIPRLSISQLSFKPTNAFGDEEASAVGEFDFHGIALKNVRIDAGSIDFTKQTSAFHVQTLKVQSLVGGRVRSEQPGSLHLVAHDEEGHVVSVAAMEVKVLEADSESAVDSRQKAAAVAAKQQTVLDVTTSEGLSAAKISTERIQLISSAASSIGSAQDASTASLRSAVVGIDKDGYLVGGNKLVLPELAATQSLTITADATLRMEGRSAGSLLGVKADGTVVPLAKGGSKVKKGKRNSQDEWSVELDKVSATSIAAESISGSTIEAASIRLRSDNNIFSAGTLLVVDEVK